MVPVIILYTWKSLISVIGVANVFANAITIGLVAIGLMGYSNSIARDREKGVFQRLRVAPVPRWSIMGSRLLVQLLMILLIVLCVFIGGYYFDHVTLDVSGYIITVFTALLSGAVYLSIGQLIVGSLKNPETVNATSRLVYFLFIIVGMMGQFMDHYPWLTRTVRWSPYGVVKDILAAGMNIGHWSQDNTLSLLATIGYTIVFAVIGIRNFKWSTK